MQNVPECDNRALVAGFVQAAERQQLHARHRVLDNKELLAGFIKDPQVARLLELARAADPDPWRDRFRDPAVWADPAALASLRDEVDIGRQSPTVLVTFAWLLWMNGADPMALFLRALLHHPRDFWLHLNATMFAREPGVRVGLALATLAIRPGNSLAYCRLAQSLQERGDWAEAVDAANRAIEISAKHAQAHQLLGRALRDKKDLPGAVAAFQRAADLR
jgi:tetratricopeptide (TPR) repeat protein